MTSRNKLQPFLNPFFLTLVLFVLIIPIFVDSLQEKQQTAAKASFQPTPTVTPSPTPRSPSNSAYH